MAPGALAAPALAAHQTIAFTAHHVSSKGHVEQETDVNTKGKVVGHDVLICKNTSVKNQAACTAVFKLTSPKSGSISVKVTAKFTDKTYSGPVTGGTGAYAGARGTVTITPGSGGKTKIVITLT